MKLKKKTNCISCGISIVGGEERAVCGTEL